MVAVDAGGEELLLLPQHAALLPQQRTLLVADLHIGKAVSFRRLGVPVPRGTTTETLQRLSGLIEAHDVAQVVFLGDFLHSARSHAPATLAALDDWRARHRGLELTLVRGNHDEHAGDPPPGLGFQVVDEPLRLGRLALCHHPRPVPGAYTLAGHWHPCVSLGRGIDHVRLPCFWLGAEVGILPAFGAFTGMHAARPVPGDRLFAVAGDRVHALS